MHTRCVCGDCEWMPSRPRRPPRVGSHHRAPLRAVPALTVVRGAAPVVRRLTHSGEDDHRGAESSRASSSRESVRRDAATPWQPVAQGRAWPSAARFSPSPRARTDKERFRLEAALARCGRARRDSLTPNPSHHDRLGNRRQRSRHRPRSGRERGRAAGSAPRPAARRCPVRPVGGPSGPVGGGREERHGRQKRQLGYATGGISGGRRQTVMV